MINVDKDRELLNFFERAAQAASPAFFEAQAPGDPDRRDARQFGDDKATGAAMSRKT